MTEDQQFSQRSPQPLPAAGGVGRPGKAFKGQTNSNAVEVYDPDFLHVISVSNDRIFQMPHPSLGVSRLVLCRNFTAENPAACNKGDTCKFVHADVLGAKKHPIHVNYAWRSDSICSYPRLPAGEKLLVFAPNERPPAEEIPSERVLVTRGSLMRHEHNGPLSHCAHYYFNRMCNRGERCNFIHTAMIDPTAADFQRAPAPTAVAPLPRQEKQSRTPKQQQQQQLQQLPTATVMPSQQVCAFSQPSPQLFPIVMQSQPTVSQPPPGSLVLNPTLLGNPGMPMFFQPQLQYPLMQPTIITSSTGATTTPSMTSFFVVPATASEGTNPIVGVANPFEWSLLEGIHNNGSLSSMSLSQHMSRSQSGAGAAR